MPKEDEGTQQEKKEQSKEPEQKKKGKKKMIPFLVAFVLLLGGGGAVVKMGLLPIPGLAAKKEKTEKIEEKKEGKNPQAESPLGFIYSMKPLIVNLADDSGGRYLKIKFEMELSSQAVLTEIDKRLPQVTDSVIMLLSSKSYNDMASPEGKDQMRNEIVLHLNSFLKTGTVTRIYFTEFVMQ